MMATGECRAVQHRAIKGWQQLPFSPPFRDRGRSCRTGAPWAGGIRMRITSLVPPALHWECPNCITRTVTTHPQPHVPFHNCPGLHGLTAPLVERGTRCKVEARVRDDYVGREDVTYVDGKPIMSVVTTRDDGQDCAAYVPTAHAISE